MSRPDVDPVLLDPTRLTIVSLLAGMEWAEFGWVRETAELSASALSKQVTALGGQGYVDVDKGYAGKRPRTWLNLTPAGRAALERHVTALQRIVDDARQAADPLRVRPGEGRARTGGERPGATGEP